jgi:hypothetical protein
MIMTKLALQAFSWWRRKCLRSKRYTSSTSSPISSENKNKKRSIGDRVRGCNAAILSTEKEKEERRSSGCYSPPSSFQVT